ncbi:hypothetical protein ACLOJK_004365 [Asimina triloba]
MRNKPRNDAIQMRQMMRARGASMAFMEHAHNPSEGRDPFTTRPRSWLRRVYVVACPDLLLFTTSRKKFPSSSDNISRMDSAPADLRNRTPRIETTIHQR